MNPKRILREEVELVIAGKQSKVYSSLAALFWDISYHFDLTSPKVFEANMEGRRLYKRLADFSLSPPEFPWETKDWRVEERFDEIIFYDYDREGYSKTRSTFDFFGHMTSRTMYRRDGWKYTWNFTPLDLEDLIVSELFL